MTFYQWLMKHTRRESPLGDLAADVQRDRGFPTDMDSLDRLKAYLSHKGAGSAVTQAASEAWRTYRRAVKRAQEST